MKVLEKLDNKKPSHNLTGSPNQHPIYKRSNEIKPIDKEKRSIVNFDDMLGARNSSHRDIFFTRGKHEIQDFCYISQSSFGLPSIRNNSDKIILFKQRLRDVHSM